MAAKSQPYQLTWEGDPQDLKEINRRLALQLIRANEMIESLYKAVENLTARVEALE